AADGMVPQPLAIRAELPRRGTRPSGPVGEATDGVLEGPPDTIDDERVLPVLRIPVAAGVGETLELGVRDLVPIDPEIRQPDCRASFLRPSAAHIHHSRGRLPRAMNRDERPDRRRSLGRIETVLDDLPPEFTDWKARFPERDAPDELPRTVDGEIVLEVHIG